MDSRLPIPVEEQTVEQYLKDVSAYHEQRIEMHAEQLCKKLRSEKERLVRLHFQAS
jgi:hypothetical protein